MHQITPAHTRPPLFPYKNLRGEAYLVTAPPLSGPLCWVGCRRTRVSETSFSSLRFGSSATVMGSRRDQGRSNVQTNLTSTLRAVQETGRLLPHTSRAALLQTHDPIPSPAGHPPAGQTEESNDHENGRTGNGFFDCNICFEVAVDPVLTPCGHLFCWPCIYQWMNGGGFHPHNCPVCMGNVESDNVIPIYGRGPENRRAPGREPPRTMIPPRPPAQRVNTTEVRRPPLTPRASLRQRPFTRPTRGAGARTGMGAGAGASLGPPMVDFLGVTAIPFSSNQGIIPLEGPAYFHQPLDTGIYYAPIIPFLPQSHHSFTRGGRISNAARNRRPPAARIMQRALHNVNQFVESVQRESSRLLRGVHDGLLEGLAEMINNMEDNEPPRSVNAGTEEGGSGPTSIPDIVQPEPSPLPSSSAPGTHRGSTSPVRSVGESSLPPEKRSRY